MRRAYVYGVAGAAGPVVMAAAAIVAARVQTTYSSRSEDLSGLWAGDAQHGWVRATATLFLGLCTMALAVGLRGSLTRGDAADPGIALLMAAGTAMAAVAAFPNDCSTELPSCAARVRDGEVSWQHSAHDVASLVAFGLLLAVPIVLAVAFRQDPRWQHLAGFSRLSGGLSGLLLLTYLAGTVVLDDGQGLLQRLFLAVPLTWIAVVGWTLARMPLGQQRVADTGGHSTPSTAIPRLYRRRKRCAQHGVTVHRNREGT